MYKAEILRKRGLNYYFFFLFLTLFSDCCIPTAGTWLCPIRMVPQGGWWDMLLHTDAPHRNPPLIHPAEPSQQAFLSFPDSTWGQFKTNLLATGGGYGQGLWDRDCQARGTNAAGLVGAQSRASCPEAK